MNDKVQNCVWNATDRNMNATVCASAIGANASMSGNGDMGLLLETLPGRLARKWARGL